MTKKHLGFAVALALATAAIVFVLPVLAGPPQPQDPEPIRRGDVIDIGPVLRAKDLPVVGIPDVSPAGGNPCLMNRLPRVYESFSGGLLSGMYAWAISSSFQAVET